MGKYFAISVFMTVFVPFITESATAVSSSERQKSIATERIDLWGKFGTGGGLRSVGDADITVCIRNGAIEAIFHGDVGDILITFTDVAGDTVYETTMNTSVQQRVFIPLSRLASGRYTITFSNDFGMMYGDFDL